MKKTLKALIVGIDKYKSDPLTCCALDAKRMLEMLSKHADGTRNFACQLYTSEKNEITRPFLLAKIVELLDNVSDGVVFYFSGHGSRNLFGGHLVTMDHTADQPGVAFDELNKLLLKSQNKHVVVILDCCYAGGAGNDDAIANPVLKLREGVTIMAASQAQQTSKATKDGSIFTSLLIDALQGEAADILGNVTVAGMFNHADALLDSWQQRPMFKSHVSSMVRLRKVQSAFPIQELGRLRTLFPKVDHEIQLDPSYEPTSDHPDPVKVVDFAWLQRFRAAGLVEPMVPHEHMYFAAMESGKCRLTPRGRFYYKLGI